MRILFIAPIPFFYERGACIRSRNMITAAGKLGHEVDIVTYPVGENLRIPNVEIIRTSSVCKPPLEARMNVCRAVTDLFLYRKSMEMVSKREYQCIIGKTPIGRWIGRKVKDKTGIPLVIDVVEPALGMVRLYAKRKLFDGFFLSKVTSLAVRNPLTVGFLKGFEEANYRSADVILANWDLVAEEVSRQSDRECLILYDTLPEVLKHPPRGVDLRGRYGISSEEKVLLYTGAFTPQQGIEVYLGALRHMRNKKVKLVLVGPKKDKYVKMAADLGVGDRVIFTDRLPMKELPDYFSMADVLLTAYNSGGLNATVKLLIYLFQRKPVVASDVPQYRQIIDERVAFMAAPTAEAFAAKIDYVLENPMEAEKVAENAWRYAEEKFSEKAYQRRIKRLFDIVEDISTRN